jgi:hypothetical protein
MKKASVCLLVVVVSAMSQAGIAPAPGTQRVKPVFDASDLVCNCYVRALDPNRVNADSETAVVEVRDVYKGERVPGSAITVTHEKGALWRGETAILFLRSASESYRETDSFLGATPFLELRPVNADRGLEKLELALADVLDKPDRSDNLNAMRLLQGLDQLNPRTMASVTRLSSSTDHEVAFGAIAVALRTRSASSVGLLRDYLKTYHGDDALIPLMSIGEELGQINDVSALPAINQLTTSSLVGIRRGAMQALRGIKDPRSAPILIQRLNDSDVYVRYLAVATLAETFSLYGDYAPNMQAFEQTPTVYVDRWKVWWSQQGHPTQ